MVRPIAVMDIECYRHYFLIMFRDVTKKKYVGYEMYPGSEPLNRRAILQILNKYTIVTFNGRNYDIPMLSLALKGATCEQLKNANDTIFSKRLKPWEFEDKYGAKPPKFLDHIDLSEPAPGVMVSLKIYGGRSHSELMQDLPYEPDHHVQPHERPVIFKYCGNDLQTTIDLYEGIKKQIELRINMSAEYGMDMRSKSDAQIGEAVIRQAVEKERGHKIYPAEYKNGFKFKYKAPSFIRFKTKQLQDILELVESVDFVVDRSKKKDSTKQVVHMPEELKKLIVTIGNSSYKLGIGGLHSKEKSVHHLADKKNGICDIDAKSFYPYLILNQGLYPVTMGPVFITIYGKIVEVRVHAKDTGDEVKADSGKIIINGSFGKLGNVFSVLYAPELLIQTTITGQLALFMAIESLETEGIPVVSANTDGIVVRYPRDKEKLMRSQIETFEMITGLEMEYTYYKGIYSRDVNNYLAVYEKPKEDKKTGVKTYAKTKGAYAPTGLMKNPAGNICVKAAVDFIVHGTPVEQTIEDCEDVKQFVFIKKVAGGGVHGGTRIVGPKKNKKGKVTMQGIGVEGGEYLGKAVRFYYSEWSHGPILYKTNGNKVGDSEGCAPLMNLPKELPDDLDYDKYIARAHGILAAVGIGSGEASDVEWDEPDEDDL